jgi:hypothetical protein
MASRAALVLVLLQFLFLAIDVRALWQPGRRTLLFDPGAALPTKAHRQASEELLAFVRAQPDPVLVPDHGWIAPMAGKPAWWHGQAIGDLLQGLIDPVTNAFDPGRVTVLSPRYRDALQHSFFEPFIALLQARHWSAIVIDRQDHALFEGLFNLGLAGYHQREQPILSHPEALRPLVGREIDSPVVLERKP